LEEGERREVVESIPAARVLPLPHSLLLVVTRDLKGEIQGMEPIY